MNNQQSTALQHSIEHWADMLKPENWQGVEEPRAMFCACCKAFECEDCPICQYTGQDDCEGTPFYDARTAWLRKEQEDFKQYGGSMVSLMVHILKEGRKC